VPVAVLGWEARAADFDEDASEGYVMGRDGLSSRDVREHAEYLEETWGG
jgi:hypothetical protein